MNFKSIFAAKKIFSKRKNHYSQSGEDGLLEYVLSKIPDADGWCVEFGAWDGMFLSNTFYLIKEKGYKGILIEMDPDRCDLLSRNMSPYGCHCINKMVDYKGTNTLDNILSDTEIPSNFDLLSIDIDGNDYHIWNSLVKYTPKVVIIELNYRDKPNIDHINDPDAPFEGGVTGTSVKSMTELAKAKGYCLISVIGCNAVYARPEYLHLFYDVEPLPMDCFSYEGFRRNELTLSEYIQKQLLRKFDFLAAINL